MCYSVDIRCISTWLKDSCAGWDSVVAVLTFAFGLLIWVYKQLKKLCAPRNVCNNILSTCESPVGDFVGRSVELSSVYEQLLHSNVLIVHGAGGVGKSELVKQFIFLHHNEYGGGCFQVDADSVVDWNDVFSGLMRRDTSDGMSPIAHFGIVSDCTESYSSITPDVVRNSLLQFAATNKIFLFLDNVRDVGRLFSSDALRRAGLVEFVRAHNVRIVATTRLIDTSLDDSIEDCSIDELKLDDAIELFVKTSGLRHDVAQCEKIVHKLGRRALYVRKVASLFKDPLCLSSCATFEWIEKELSLNAISFLEDRIDDSKTPVVLWKMVCDRIVERPNGLHVIQLAKLISLLSPGVRYDIVQYVWQCAIMDREPTMRFADEDMEGAIRVLCELHVLNRRELWTMHPIDQQVIYNDVILNDFKFVKKIADALVACPSMDRRNWAYAIRKNVLIRFIPPYMIDGWMSVKILLESGEYASQCDWSLLKGRDWARLLREQPKYAKHCNFDLLNSDNIAFLLRKQPSFLDKFDVLSLSSSAIVDILSERPDIASMKHFPIRKLIASLDGIWQARLVAAQPRFVRYCRLDSFKGKQWAILLGARPEFDKNCVWTGFRGSDWAQLLCEQPKYEEKCEWHKFKSADWATLLRVRPEFADKCNWRKLKQNDIVKILIEQPQFKSHYDVSKLSQKSMTTLIAWHPEWFGVLNGKQLTSKQWIRILKCSHKLSEFCPWETFTSQDWVTLLKTEPRYCYYCDFENLSSTALDKLLQCQPQFLKFRKE